MTLKFDIDGVEKIEANFSEEDKETLRELAKWVKTSRPLNKDLFLTEEEFNANPQYKNVNPGPHNDLPNPTYDTLRLDVIESNEEILGTLLDILGADLNPFDKKFVVGMPDSEIPQWIKDRNIGRKVGNLGAYVKPEYRDMTYFYGIDMHQDTIDWPNQNTDMVTMYVYLEDVDAESSPLHVVPGSHANGIDIFPHDLEVLDNGKLRYFNRVGNGGGVYDIMKITGEVGTTHVWHSCILHGTAPTKSDKPRVSLRYLIRKYPSKLDKLNERIGGPQSLEKTRNDLDETGEDVLKGKDMLEIDK